MIISQSLTNLFMTSASNLIKGRNHIYLTGPILHKNMLTVSNYILSLNSVLAESNVFNYLAQFLSQSSSFFFFFAFFFVIFLLESNSDLMLWGCWERGLRASQTSGWNNLQSLVQRRMSLCLLRAPGQASLGEILSFKKARKM